MTQFQFDMICKIIESGAPALANELNGSLNDLVQDYNKCIKENDVLKAQVEALKNPPVDDSKKTKKSEN